MSKLILLFPVLFAAVCILAALWLRRKRRDGIRHPVYAQAVVISTVRQMEIHHNAAVERIAPVMQYRTEQGEITATYHKYLPEWQYSLQKGECVPICYEREKPTQFCICREQKSIWASNFLLVTAFGTLLAYAVLWLQYYE
ncbi:MAG: DUF3592 domain-containing protein [Ruminococcus sp.]|nr:DUF3592 domain-containing protein [Ruminococcus sp.]